MIDRRKLYRVVYRPNAAATGKVAYYCKAKDPTEARVLARVACGIKIIILEAKEARGGEFHAEND